MPRCQHCHGGDGSAAPPASVLGYRASADRAVGAHRRHLEAHADAVRAPIACEECHVVPSRVEGHYRDAAARVTFGGPLAGGRPTTAWNTATLRCENVYCHGETLEGGDAKDPLWTLVDGSQRRCGSCHGDPPASHASFGDAWNCNPCHPGTVLARGASTEPAVIDLAGGRHIDGTRDVPSGGACDLCHAAPPDTGAHLAHANPSSPDTLSYGSLAVAEDVSPGGGTRYEFGCGHCHPLDAADHLADAGSDGLADVVLEPPATAVAGDEVKGRNDPAAAFDPASGTCSGAYCHSSGQATPAYVTTPAWTAAPGALGCAGCHGNPPRYPSGGPGTATANSHVNLDAYETWGWEFGHFAGMPGAYHTSKHGGYVQNGFAAGHLASPITCQACHFESVDPAHVRPDGFFYFDPGGDYDLRPDGDPSRATNSSWLAMQCTTCHASELSGGGRALPLRHVNGRRDVAFDPRPALPEGYPPGLPALATADPVRPYYMTVTNGIDVVATAADCTAVPAPPSCGVAADVVVRKMAAGVPPPEVLTFTLEHAAWDPATKTCSAVACHLEHQRQVEAGTRGALRWGAPYAWETACTGCHEM